MHFLGKRRGVDNGNNVMLNKTGFIAGRATCLAKPVLNWSQRTKPTAKLDQGRPQDSRDMDTGPPFPPEYQEPAEHCKCYEAEVDENRHVSEYSVMHSFRL